MDVFISAIPKRQEYMQIQPRALSSAFITCGVVQHGTFSGIFALGDVARYVVLIQGTRSVLLSGSGDGRE
jgi:hypothetical protein